MEIDDMLSEIDALRSQNLRLGTVKHRRDFEQLLGYIFMALLLRFWITSGYQRRYADGADLLFLIYLSYFVGKMQKK
jgi:hypothetical protein